MCRILRKVVVLNSIPLGEVIRQSTSDVCPTEITEITERLTNTDYTNLIVYWSLRSKLKENLIQNP